MDLHLGNVSLQLLNNFTTVVQHQPEKHFDQFECVAINGHTFTLIKIIFRLMVNYSSKIIKHI